MAQPSDYERALAELMNARAEVPTRVEELPLLDAALDLMQAIRDAVLLDSIGRGHTQAEIAQQLGITQQSVSTQIRKARERENQRLKILKAARKTAWPTIRETMQ